MPLPQKRVTNFLRAQEKFVVSKTIIDPVYSCLPWQECETDLRKIDSLTDSGVAETKKNGNGEVTHCLWICSPASSIESNLGNLLAESDVFHASTFLRHSLT
uniref:Uncharacterized protein n=2 Tax=Pseudictyota dubia TaxID=2749911 RepID=A0A7R9VSM5_9STRA|mmetsp:Transcript_22252/g.41492  ORF Transcript_22252/g.41492 Transcript_22252/m.41492 type:complete len:102 (+) Transcript_22252:144-449(+)